MTDTFAALAALRSNRTRAGIYLFAAEYGKLSLADMCRFWQYMIAEHAQSDRDREFFAARLQKAQDGLWKVLA